MVACHCILRPRSLCDRCTVIFRLWLAPNAFSYMIAITGMIGRRDKLYEWHERRLRDLSLILRYGNDIRLGRLIESDWKKSMAMQMIWNIIFSHLTYQETGLIGQMRVTTLCLMINRISRIKRIMTRTHKVKSNHRSSCTLGNHNVLLEATYDG